ncbi:uncharacterized protein LOC119730010 [Patiria miniata]|uniref:Uncharacterized protein n=1 Tax=Patiria miniata TaxID=46514 RepID=A0A914A4H6_PATMI|nr:uncharacterized protein LOC119730010 [Patiria miniata]
MTVFLTHLAPSEAVNCYQCTPANSGCGDDPFDASNHQDWLKPCPGVKTCLKTYNDDNLVSSRACNTRDECLGEEYLLCNATNYCVFQQCCYGDGCNSAPVAIPFSVLLTAFMVPAIWVFIK